MLKNGKKIIDQAFLIKYAPNVSKKRKMLLIRCDFFQISTNMPMKYCQTSYQIKLDGSCKAGVTLLPATKERPYTQRYFHIKLNQTKLKSDLTLPTTYSLKPNT